MENQKARRAAMSRARNSLLFTTLGPSTSWVLWLDSDVIETPSTLIQDLASHDKAIIVRIASRDISTRRRNRKRRGRTISIAGRTARRRGNLGSRWGRMNLVGGICDMATYRTLMHIWWTTGEIQSRRLLLMVWGNALLVKAEVHRDGAMFPPFPFYHLIETEGFDKKALGMAVLHCYHTSTESLRHLLYESLRLNQMVERKWWEHSTVSMNLCLHQ